MNSRIIAIALMLLFVGWADLGAQVRTDSLYGADGGELVLRPGDVLRVRVWPDSALGGTFPIEETGIVVIPVLGELQTAQRTVRELRNELRRKYREIMKEPVVTITPQFRVSVIGAVQRPGLYQIDHTHSLFDVISLVGGFTSNARSDAIQVVRQGRVLEVNAKRALQTGDALSAIQLRSGDKIVVPTRGGFVSWSMILQMTTLGIALGNLLRN